MLASPIIPAIIPDGLPSVVTFLDSLPGVPEIHLDVVDGQFVPFTSWPYLPAGSPAEIATLCESRTLEVDLMVEHPVPAARAWLAAGADMLVFHIETITAVALEHFMSETAITIGVAANNDTPNDTLLPYLGIADYVQVMGIQAIGTQGQPFDERALARIEWLRRINPALAVSIDGSVNRETLPQLASLKLNRYIVGSAITKAETPRAVYNDFTKLVLQQATAE